MIAQEISLGGTQLEDTLDLSATLTQQWGRHPLFVRMARRIVEDAGAKTPEQEATAVWNWIKKKVRYRRDPIDAEWVQDPFETIVKSKAGDCDDMAVAVASLLRAIGHDAEVVAIQWEGRKDPSHAVVADLTSRKIVDTVPGAPPPGQWPPANRKVHAIIGRTSRPMVPGSLDGLFSIRSWTSALSKIHKKIGGALGLNRIKAFRKLDANIIGQLNKVDRSLSKDFKKAKVWSQTHRKTLQIVGAVAAVAVGGWMYLASKAAAAAAAGAGTAAGAGAGAGAAAGATITTTAATNAAAATVAKAGWSATLKAIAGKLVTPTIVQGVLGVMQAKAQAGQASPEEQTLLSTVPADYQTQMAAAASGGMAPSSYPTPAAEMPEATVEVTDTAPQETSPIPVWVMLGAAGLVLFFIVKGKK